MRNLLTITLLILAIEASGQKYLPGYIVENNGDTTRGYLSRQSLKNGYRNVSFRATVDGETKRYLPGDIGSFGASDVLFRSRVIGETGKPEQLQFVRTYVDGGLLLFGSSENRYWIGSDTVPGNFVINKNRNYLNYFAASCVPLSRDIKKFKLDRDELVEFFHEVYKCNGNVQYKVHLKPRKPYLYNFYVNAGYSVSDFVYEQLPFAGYPDPIHFASSMSPLAGISLETYLSAREQRRVSFTVSLLTSHALFQAIVYDFPEPDYYFASLLYEYVNFQLPVVVKYDVVSKKNLRISAGAGFAYNYQMKKRAELTVDDYTASGIRTEQFDVSEAFHYRLFETTAALGIKSIVNDRSLMFELRPAFAIASRFSIKTLSLAASIPLNRNPHP